jgi:hypothetical protein
MSHDDREDEWPRDNKGDLFREEGESDKESAHTEFEYATPSKGEPHPTQEKRDAERIDSSDVKPVPINGVASREESSRGDAGNGASRFPPNYREEKKKGGKGCRERYKS